MTAGRLARMSSSASTRGIAEMKLDRASFERLRGGAASSFDTDNHKSYLAEALQCVLETKDPVSALRLLMGLWGPPYAYREKQQPALNDVGKWLEGRLLRDPPASYEVIALELGWLRRFAAIAARRRDSHTPAAKRSSGTRLPKPQRAFGAQVAEIEKRRAAAVAKRGATARVDPPPPPPPPPPDRLPAVFAAQFVDFPDAREARKTARKRAKSGKPAKDRLLAVRPVDPQLIPLATGLVCSILETAGIDAPFEANQWTFYVTAFDELGEGKRLVRAIALQPSQGGVT